MPVDNKYCTKKWQWVKKMRGNYIKRVGFLLQTKTFDPHILNVMFIRSKLNPLILSVINGSIFKKIYRAITWKDFLNYSTLKMTLLNILQNFTIYLFK